LSPTNKRRLTVALAVAGLLLLAVIATLATRGGSASALDSRLKQAADRHLPMLNHAPLKLPVTDSSLNSYKAWFYDEQQAFVKIAHDQHVAGQFEQVQFSDPNTMPPQDLGLNAPGRPFVTLDSGTTTQAATSGKPQYTDVQQGGLSYRAYIVPIALPAALRGSGIFGLLEVLAPK
jgi:hypothetical protein